MISNILSRDYYKPSKEKEISELAKKLQISFEEAEKIINGNVVKIEQIQPTKRTLYGY